MLLLSYIFYYYEFMTSTFQQGNTIYCVLSHYDTILVCVQEGAFKLLHVLYSFQNI